MSTKKIIDNLNVHVKVEHSKGEVKIIASNGKVFEVSSSCVETALGVMFAQTMSHAHNYWERQISEFEVELIVKR